MKRLTAVFLTVLLIGTALCGCTGGNTAKQSTDAADSSESSQVNTVTPENKTELIVFAAASMTETLNEIKKIYETENPDITLTYTFDSSGTLKTQIEEGAECDLFISAANKQMDQLDITSDSEKNPDGLDYIIPETRISLLENKVTLCVPENNPKNITSFDVLAEMFKNGDEVLMAMGNEDVPVGQYTQKILSYYSLDEKELADSGKITYGSNVKEVTTQISEGTVDCGVIYSTDAYSAGLTVTDTATEEMCGKVIYPAAVLKNSKNIDAAKAFLDYLTKEKAGSIFSSVGFTPVAV